MDVHYDSFESHCIADESHAIYMDAPYDKKLRCAVKFFFQPDEHNLNYDDFKENYRRLKYYYEALN